MKPARPLLVALLLPLVTACSGGGEAPAQDASKTPEQIQAEADGADKVTLEQTVAQYKAAIDAKKQEIAGLDQEIKAQVAKSTGDVVDLLSGDSSKAKTIDTDLKAMKERVQTLQSELATLQAKLAIYTEELAGR